MTDPAVVDHTVLGPETTPDDVRRVVDEAAEFGVNACVPPCYLSLARERTDGTLVTVVGFPHGQHAPATKAVVRQEIEAVVAATPLPVKMIVEAGLLEESEKRAAGDLARGAGADYLTASTGFAGGRATTADVATLSAFLPVKASGGVRTPETAQKLLDAGAERVGTSSGPAVLGVHKERS
jgi:deoxyribose-phosphate aldolase